MRRLRCVCCALMRDVALYVTSACHAQDKNQISRLDGVVFPERLTWLDLVSFCCCLQFFCDVWMRCVRQLRCVCCAMMRDVALYVTSACHAQKRNNISRLDGVVFPARLFSLVLVSFCDCWHLFRGVWM